LRQLERPNLEGTIATLASLPADTPCPAQEAWRGVAVPTLVLVNELDALHPVEYGRRLAAGIAGARLVQIAPKEKDPPCTRARPGKPSKPSSQHFDLNPSPLQAALIPTRSKSLLQRLGRRS
jgi:hypothetical protein